MAASTAASAYEATLNATLSGACLRDGEIEGNGAGSGEDKQVGEEEDQPDEQRHFAQREVIGVAPVVQCHREPGGKHREQKMMANIAGCGAKARSGPRPFTTPSGRGWLW